MPPAKRRRVTRAAAAAAAAEAAVAPESQEQADAIEAPQPDKETKSIENSVETVVEDQPMETVVEVVTAVPEPEPFSAPIKEKEKSPAAETPADASEEVVSAADAAHKAQERLARFKALKARAKSSSDQNLKAAHAESHRLAADPAQLTAIHRKHATASHKLLKAEIEEAGGDFERKRAWDWTAEESEKWDKRVRKKEANADNNAFQDYRAEAQKVYKRQLKNLTPDMERYAKEKMATIERAAANGTLEIVETEDGEMIAVDRDGSFYSTADRTNFADNKPSKAAIDRLVNDQKKADEVALRKRRERMAKNGDDEDISYINEKNKQFSQKLNRFYNKYTAEIRDSFERGTMI